MKKPKQTKTLTTVAPIRPTTVPAPEPEWLKTPEDWGYQLDMWDEAEGETVQAVELSRAEYIELKKHLARLRDAMKVNNAA